MKLNNQRSTNEWFEKTILFRRKRCTKLKVQNSVYASGAFRVSSNIAFFCTIDFKDNVLLFFFKYTVEYFA